MKRIFIISTILLAASSSLLPGCKQSSDKKTTQKAQDKVLYQCPMDCESGKIYERPGKCPVCEMDLDVKV